MSFGFSGPSCLDCGSENLKQKPDPDNPAVTVQWCDDCGEVQ